MSRTLKCAGCGGDICIGDKIYCLLHSCDFYCDDCISCDILDESYFEEDDSHAFMEEKILTNCFK